MGWIRILVLFIHGILRSRIELAVENLALRQQPEIVLSNHGAAQPGSRKAPIRVE